MILLRRIRRLTPPALLVAVCAAASAVSAAPVVGGGEIPPESLTIRVFEDATVHFHPDSSAKYVTAGVTAEENGRIASALCLLPEWTEPHRITALLTLKPIPKSAREVFDRWDRAGNIRLALDGGPDIEIVRFMTSYGGRTDHEVDVTHLAPLLRGQRRIRAFVDTWVSPGWRIDFALRYTPAAEQSPATWAAPVCYTDALTGEEMPEGMEAMIEVPPGLARVVLKVFSTGHCTDGTDADEFISKANVISVDGVVVARYHPWRNDCRDFRERNPYTARWTDGSWSSDYHRSGWCPGVEVLPVEFDLTDHLTPGRHVLRFLVEDIRPRNDEGHYGYWRISAHVVGWSEPPALWRNED